MRAAALSVLGARTMYMSCFRRARPTVADAHRICRVDDAGVAAFAARGLPRYPDGERPPFPREGAVLEDSQTRASRSSCAKGLVVWCSRRDDAVVVCKSRSTSSSIKVCRLVSRASATDRYKSCCSRVPSSLLDSSLATVLSPRSLASLSSLASRCLAYRALLCSLDVATKTFLISFRSCKNSFGVPAKNIGSCNRSPTKVDGSRTPLSAI
mmetsp:Transcript_17900/g.49596  ORF Transcript_17900/g.49596 Transcript_17900/m.49596 type:complete len:211 (-) Transcript_17900:627-1259(-)